VSTVLAAVGAGRLVAGAAVLAVGVGRLVAGVDRMLWYNPVEFNPRSGKLELSDVGGVGGELRRLLSTLRGGG
jgi:X-X-X-Leu-X-X-Gly heptad repeat protein